MVTGPVISDQNGDGRSDYAIGGNLVAVPGGYYKIVMARGADELPAILAFLYPNAKGGRAKRHLTSVDRIEDLTEIDFFSDLEDATEDKLEAIVPESLWAQ